MAVMTVWEGGVYKRDNKTGGWSRKRVVVTRNHELHVMEEGTSRRKGRLAFDSSATFNLDLFKVEVGAVEEVPEAGGLLFCLFLVSGHIKVSFGFESKAVLQVSSDRDVESFDGVAAFIHASS